MMEHDLYLMVDWFKANKLLLNLSKTVAMRFWTSTNKFELKIENFVIPLVESTKFLGVHIDNQLTWHEHANYLINKLNTNRQLLSMGKHILDKNCLCNVYFAHVHSHLNYGLLAWGTMVSTTQLKELWKIQQQCVELISKSKDSGTGEHMRSLNIMTLDKMIQLSLCKLGYKITHKVLPTLLLMIFNANRGKKTHRYPTRNRQTSNVQRHHSTKFNRSFLCQSIMEYSKLSEHLKRETHPTHFERLLKKHVSQL